MLVFDIGFNLGNFSQQVLSQFPTARVIAVEANPMHRVPANIQDRVTLLNYCMGAKDGEILDFHLSTNHGICTASKEWIEKGRHGHYFNGTGSLGTIRVPSMTLDTLIATYGVPDVCKIDVENYEYEVVQGLTKGYPNMVISFEWAEELFKNTEKVVKHLQSLGYTQYACSVDNDDFIACRPSVTWEASGIHSILTGQAIRWGMIYASM